MVRAVQKIDIESIPGTVVLANDDGIIEYVNQQCLDATGFTLSEMVGTPFLNLWKIKSETIDDIRGHLEHQPVWRNVIQHKRKDGSFFKEVSAISKLAFEDESGFFLLKVGQPFEMPHPQQQALPDQKISQAEAADDSSEMQDDFCAILDAAPYAIAVNRLSDQHYVFFNKAFCQHTGYSPEEITGKTPRELNLFHDPADWERMCEAVQNQEKLDGFEVTFRRKDYRLSHNLVSVRVINFSGAWCMLYISQDIEEVKTEREALRQSVENYRTIIEGAPVAISITRQPDGVYQEVNDTFCRSVHFSREEVLGRTAVELKLFPTPEDRRLFVEQFARQGYMDNLEMCFYDRYGNKLERLVSARRLRYKGQDCLLYISTGIDKLKAVQRALAEREENYRAVLDLAPHNISISRLSDGVYMQVNKAFCLRTGYAAEEILGKTAYELDFFADPSDRQQLMEMLKRDGRVDDMEIPVRIRAGQLRDALVSMRCVHFQDEDCILSMTIDITEQKAAQRAIAESEVRFRTIFETAADPIFLIDMETGRFLDVNHAASRHLGYDRSEFLKMSFNDIHPPEILDALPWFSEDIGGNKSLFYESQHVRKDGSTAIVEVSSQQMTHQGQRVLLSIVRDVTERKQIEEELSGYRKSLEMMVAERTRELKTAQQALVEKEKMAVLGQLAATFSHELRNPLGVIRYSNYFLQRKVEYHDGKIEKHFKRIDDQVSLCNDIVSDLLHFTEGRPVVTVFQDFAGWLTDLVEAQNRQMDFEFNFHIAPELPKIAYDREKTEHVITNLLSNAAQAVSDRAKESKERGIAYHAVVDVDVRLKDDRLILEIKDNGVGMHQKALSSAFEPLYSTRARGTGMGLAIAKKNVEEHGGSIALESRLGEGTIVRLSLPLSVHSKEVPCQ